MKKPRKIDKIEKICEGELVDVITGPMTPRTVSKELVRVFDQRIPEDIVVTMKGTSLRIEGEPVYQTSIYMSKEDFVKYGVKI